ncbi:MAG TPA: N-formylglutamate amidohydrolase [Phycisphaerales bacterium]|nr:N-formylglutamate amidohydrolase [Phycisphaerales bacterium]
MRPPSHARPPGLILTCEHAGNRVPRGFEHALAGLDDLLESHRGWDPGALELARTFQRRLGAPLRFATTTRLLGDLNRSWTNRPIRAEVRARLTPEQVRTLHGRVWLPYRRSVGRLVRAELGRAGRVLHLSVHTCTPVLDGEVRRLDVGFLYDPARARERAFADRWLARLRAVRPDLLLRRNYPYRGASDGLVTALRRELPASRYVGIELEVSQKHPLGGGPQWRRLKSVLAETLAGALGPA